MTIRLPRVGDQVNVIEKRNYENGQLTTGFVKRTLSHPRQPHPRGNKVELTDGTVGRVVSFVDEVGRQVLVNPLEREGYREEIKRQQSEVRPDLSSRKDAVLPGDFLEKDDLR